MLFACHSYYTFDHDPLACTLALRDAGVDPDKVIYDTEVTNNICAKTDMHKYNTQAVNIKEFYKSKMLMYSLKGVLNSSFRRNLLTLLSEEKNEYDYGELKQLCSLPRMYYEDSVLEGVRKHCNTEYISQKTIPTPTDVVGQLALLGSHTKRSRRITAGARDKEYACYWFYDEQNRANLIEMDLDCPFRNIWTDLIQHTLTVKGTRTVYNRDQVNFYTWTRFEILDK